MIIYSALLIISTALLWVGSECAVRGNKWIAKAFDADRAFIDSIVVSVTTSLPALAVSLQAAHLEASDIVMGTIIGSNMYTIMFVLGIAALICPISIAKKISPFESIMTVVALCLLIAMCYIGTIGRINGVCLLIFFISYLRVVYLRNNKKQVANDVIVPAITKPILNPVQPSPLPGLVTHLAYSIGGLAMIITGAKIVITTVMMIGETYHISGVFLGITVVAITISLPEMVTAIIAAYWKHSYIALGNVIGSNLFNILGVLGITAIIKPLTVNKVFLYFDLWVLLTITLAIFLAIFAQEKISRTKGMLCIVSYFLYIIAII